VVAIPKATSREHLAATATVFDVEFTAEEMRQVADAACRRGSTISIRR
jgi:diketogulonate reductase-like aldo/keto reductase